MGQLVPRQALLDYFCFYAPVSFLYFEQVIGGAYMMISTDVMRYHPYIVIVLAVNQRLIEGFSRQFRF